jgi:hypothetical protein
VSGAHLGRTWQPPVISRDSEKSRAGGEQDAPSCQCTFEDMDTPESDLTEDPPKMSHNLDDDLAFYKFIKASEDHHSNALKTGPPSCDRFSNSKNV